MRRWLVLVVPIVLCAIAIGYLVARAGVPLIRGDRVGITCIASPVDYYPRRSRYIHVGLIFGWAAVVAATAVTMWARGMLRRIAAVVLVVSLGTAFVLTVNTDEFDLAPLHLCVARADAASNW